MEPPDLATTSPVFSQVSKQPNIGTKLYVFGGMDDKGFVSGTVDILEVDEDESRNVYNRRGINPTQFMHNGNDTGMIEIIERGPLFRRNNSFSHEKK